MSLIRQHFETRETWLEGRGAGIGASEAAAILGLSPWMSGVELWRQKLGASQAKDLSGNAAVAQGVRLEDAIRSFFMALHPEYTLEYYPYDMLSQSERPWLFATLDGELTDWKGRRGILEIKDATPNGRAGWDKWSGGKVPQNYFVQVMHQFLATGYDFAVLFACLHAMDGSVTMRPYDFERSDHAADMRYVLEREIPFWENVQTGTLPPTVLTL